MIIASAQFLIYEPERLKMSFKRHKISPVPLNSSALLKAVRYRRHLGLASNVNSMVKICSRIESLHMGLSSEKK